MERVTPGQRPRPNYGHPQGCRSRVRLRRRARPRHRFCSLVSVPLVSAVQARWKCQSHDCCTTARSLPPKSPHSNAHLQTPTIKPKARKSAAFDEVRVVARALGEESLVVLRLLKSGGHLHTVVPRRRGHSVTRGSVPACAERHPCGRFSGCLSLLAARVIPACAERHPCGRFSGCLSLLAARVIPACAERHPCGRFSGCLSLLAARVIPACAERHPCGRFSGCLSLLAARVIPACAERHPCGRFSLDPPF